MGVASTVTWLSLDRWAEIMGLNPLHFNGLSAAVSPDNTCGDYWSQFNWQQADRVSREELASTIRDAELQISEYVHYNLMPDWVADERAITARTGGPGLFSNGLNVRGMPKSVKTKRGHVISGGQRTATPIELGATPNESDEDGDTYNETITVTVVTSVTSADEIHVFYPGMGGVPEWEIRPLNSVIISGGSAVITFRAWQLVDHSQQWGFGALALDGDDSGSYVATVDVYRIWNDPQAQLQLMWEDYANCDNNGVPGTLAIQNGFMTVRLPETGFVTYWPGEWDGASGAFQSGSLLEGRDPEQLRLWYLAGWKGNRLARPRADLDPYWEKAIAYFACGLFEREICGCDNVSTLVDHWKEDLAHQGKEGGTQLTASQVACPFGTSRGALYAWEKANGDSRRLA